jgi:hypothetical protein
VAADFGVRLGQVRENGSVVLAVGGAADIVFAPDAEGLMLPAEIVSALLDASVVVDEAARAVRVTRGGARAETVREGARHAAWELYQLDYEYDFNHYGTAFGQNLTLRSSGRLADGRFGLMTNSVGGKGTYASLLRNVTFTFERPNGQRFVGGDFGTGTDLEFISAAVRGAQFEFPAGRARVTAFAGRTISGVPSSEPSEVPLPSPPEAAGLSPQSLPSLSRLSYDTNVFGAYATFGPPADGRPRGGLFGFSAGALRFGGPRRGGEMAAGGVRYASLRSRVQADVALGRFRGAQREGVRAGGAALAADFSGSFNLTDDLTLQGRYAYTGANFLNPQAGLHDPVNMAAGGVTWRARKWVTASLNASTATRPGVAGQRNRFVTSALSLTPPRRGLPSVFFSHTQSSTPQVRSAAFTLLNVGKEFSRWRLFFNASRVRTSGAADLNAQTGASVRLGETGSLQVSQSFGSRGSLGGTADWQSRPLFDRRLSLSAGLGYYRGAGARTTLSERVSAALRLPRESALQLSYMQTQGGPTVLLSLRGSLLKRRAAERAAASSVKELSRYGSFSGRVYQDADDDGRFDPRVDRAQAGVKVRVDGNRYVVTDEGGRYRVEEVRAGEHNVYIDLLSVRADLTLLDGPQQSATLQPGRDAIVDFRLVRTGRVGGVVWFDRNENGRLDEGEQPLADVRVVMGNGRDTLTDANGAFVVGDLPPGEYVMLLDEKTLPERTRSAAGSLAVKVVAGGETGGLKFAVVALPPEVKRFSSK